MAVISIHTTDKNNDDQDTWTLERTFRVRVLDVVTGKPVKLAYADKVMVNGEQKDFSKALETRATHPFRVVKNMSKRKLRARLDSNHPWENFEIEIPGLVKWEKDSGDETKLKSTYKCVPEFFDVPQNGEIKIGDGNYVFQQVDSTSWVCVKGGGGSSTKYYAKRDLITNEKGILDVPVPFLEWLKGAEFDIRFRDFEICKADGPYSLEQLEDGHKSLEIKLSWTDGEKPIGNKWKMKVKNSNNEQEFSEELKLENAYFSEVDVTLWVVRKVKEFDADIKNATSNRGAGNPRGIMIHYNSGYAVIERRSGEANTKLLDALDEKQHEHMWYPTLPNLLLKALFGEGTSYGYHYHIDRSGHIWLAAPENKRTSHGGGTGHKEPAQVEAWKNGVDPVTDSDKLEHTFTSRSTATNTRYIGVDVIGHHANSAYYFTEHQMWYLDRLIENIQGRHNSDDSLTDVPWYRILGHEEVKTAKQDPGAALIGGLERLRGRHGATFSE